MGRRVLWNEPVAGFYLQIQSSFGSRETVTKGDLECATEVPWPNADDQLRCHLKEKC